MESQSENFNKVPFIYSPLFIAIISAFSFLNGIPFIIAIILLYLRHKKYKTISIQNVSKMQVLDDYDTKVLNAQQQLTELKEQYARLEQSLKTHADEEMNQLNNELALIKETISKERHIMADVEKASDMYLSFPESNLSIYNDMPSSEIKNNLSLLLENEKELQQNGKAVIFIHNGSNQTITDKRKQRNQLLRSFNNEADNLIHNTTARNIDSVRGKITRAFEAHNKLFSIDGVQLTREFLKSKLSRMSCLYEYQKKLEEEKELLRAQKDQIREEEKVRRELDVAKKKIEKDEMQFNNEINRMMKYLQSTSLEAEKKLYMDKIKELEERLAELCKEKETVLQRESNAKAGFVYIISNIGSFGENVYKIGMTRRLEPMDRIKELSSASVPFEFDVHAIIFSDDAPALENLLHQKFRDHEVNRVNHRKEFFRVDLEEIEKLVKDKYNNTVSFVYTPKADEYRETLRINSSSASA